MPTQIFVNLPVKDLERAKAFFAALGYSFNPMFSDHKAACMVVSDTIYVMLLVESFFVSFTGKQVCDTRVANEALLCLSQDSRESVDALIAKARAAGADVKDAEDHGFMYQCSFDDLDGHRWELVHMSGEPPQQG